MMTIDLVSNWRTDDVVFLSYHGKQANRIKLKRLLNSMDVGYIRYKRFTIYTSAGASESNMSSTRSSVWSGHVCLSVCFQSPQRHASPLLHGLFCFTPVILTFFFIFLKLVLRSQRPVGRFPLNLNDTNLNNFHLERFAVRSLVGGIVGLQAFSVATQWREVLLSG